MADLINSNPKIHLVDTASVYIHESINDDNTVETTEREEFSSAEIFQQIRHLNDPEHPLTLEQLNVLQLSNIHVFDAQNVITIYFTPTIPHCSMATLIGLCIRVKLLRSLPSRFKVKILITPGSHQSEGAVNKQLNDKERVAAALENAHLLEVVNKCLQTSSP